MLIEVFEEIQALKMNRPSEADSSSDDVETIDEEDVWEQLILAHSLLRTAYSHLAAYSSDKFKPTPKSKRVTKRLSKEINEFLTNLADEGMIEEEEVGDPKHRLPGWRQK